VSDISQSIKSRLLLIQATAYKQRKAAIDEKLVRQVVGTGQFLNVVDCRALALAVLNHLANELENVL